MSKRTVYTTVTPLPAGIIRETVMETLHNHLEMIDLNPLGKFYYYYAVFGASIISRRLLTDL
jgi:hypothetical protein